MKLLTIQELSKKLSLSPDTCRRLASRREIPAPIRIGRSVRWVDADIDEFIQSKGTANDTNRSR